MLESHVSVKKFLIFLVLCTVSVILLYQWRVQVYVVHFLVRNSTEYNTTFVHDNENIWRLPLPAAGHLDVIRSKSVQNLTLKNNITQINLRVAPTPQSNKTNVVKKATLQNSTTTTITTKAPPVLTTTAKPACKNPFRKEYVEKPNFICCHPIGGLGNNMFIYASAYGIASRLNRTLVLSDKPVLHRLFNLTARVLDDYECVIKGSKGKGTSIDCGFDKRMFEIPKGENYCVGSYLQSYKYFDHVKEDIKKQFTFQKEKSDKAKTIIESAVKTFHQRTKETDQSTRPVLVGVHVRRGDLVNNKFGYDVATPQYMEKAMAYFRTKYGKVLFLVCSNGMDWSKEHMKGDDVIFVEGNSFDVDMALLVSCNHTLSTVGSFSWWAGYLTGGETVYYQWPAREGTKLRSHFSKDYSDYFPPSWIGMR